VHFRARKGLTSVFCGVDIGDDGISFWIRLEKNVLILMGLILILLIFLGMFRHI